VLLRGPHAAYGISPYVDEHGEEDPGLRRGRPLLLDQTRLAQLHRIWASHSIAGEVVRERSMRDRAVREGFYWAKDGGESPMCCSAAREWTGPRLECVARRCSTEEDSLGRDGEKRERGAAKRRSASAIQVEIQVASQRQVCRAKPRPDYFPPLHRRWRVSSSPRSLQNQRRPKVQINQKTGTSRHLTATRHTHRPRAPAGAGGHARGLVLRVLVM